MKTLSVLIVLTALLALAILLTAGQPPTESNHFRGLGDLPGGRACSKAYAVSADGATVVGHSFSATGMEAFRWTKKRGMAGLGFPQAFAISADGSVVVGYRHIAKRAEPVRWIHDGGIFGLGKLPGCWNGGATGVSADGSVIVGVYDCDLGEINNCAFHWSHNGGIERLDCLPDGVPQAETWAVSADGVVAVGECENELGRREAFRYDAAGGMIRLGVLPGDTGSIAHGVSTDGSVVVGISYSASAMHAFRWTDATGMVSLGALPDGSSDSISSGVSADGSVIVGQCYGKAGYEAFIWDAVCGMCSVRQILVSEFGLDANLQGWKLRAATAVSADGKVVVGHGVNPHGDHEAWIAFLGDEHRPVVFAAATRAISVERSDR